jgi:hypothetical protein
MVTWIGQPVSLNATITDDGDSPVTILWEVDATGVEFDPNEFVEDPIVTINDGITYPNALIVNHSFEDGLTGWDNIGTGSGTWDGTYGGTYIIVEDGVMCAYVDSNSNDSEDAGLSQTLAESFAADTDYTLTVDVANDGYYSQDIYYKVQLLAGEYVIGEKTGMLLLFTHEGVWVPETVVYDNYTAAADANKIGLPLGIRLLATNDTNELCYDEVVLNASPEFDALSGHTYTLTFTAIDAVDYPDSDSITINVYDTPCLAGRIGLELAAKNFTDIVGDPGDPDPTAPDCDTDLYDFAAMVKTWFDEPAVITEPIVKP